MSGFSWKGGRFQPCHSIPTLECPRGMWYPCLMHLSLCRKRQVLQWVFAAAPGHPVLRELCDRIASTSAGSFSDNLNIDTLERTGPGVWTDVVLKHARIRPPSKVWSEVPWL